MVYNSKNFYFIFSIKYFIMYTKKNMETNNRSNYLRKTSTSNTLLKENEKPSQIVATNIIYNNSQKYMSNFNSNSIPREETPANISRLSAKQDNILINENKQLKDEIYELKKVTRSNLIFRKI